MKIMLIMVLIWSGQPDHVKVFDSKTYQPIFESTVGSFVLSCRVVADSYFSCALYFSNLKIMKKGKDAAEVVEAAPVKAEINMVVHAKKSKRIFAKPPHVSSLPPAQRK